jgi:acyl transferase domain-containing protein/NADPH:quinone reductase-like Zn-dependent oxidoreductase
VTISLREPIAILGAGCRFPGGITDPDTFWAAPSTRFNGISEIPSDRWNWSRFYSSSKSSQGKMYIRNGGFLHQRLDEMDAAFFGISPREAESLDPQQRLLLEVSWEAMENAGLDVRALAGTKTGVFVGGFTLDHMLNQMGSASRDHIGQHTAVGSTMTMLSNRISHAFDFRGPSISMDTACSSSLVALHQACQALWTGQCSMALAGGVNVILRPEMPIAMCKGGFLAEDGQCKSFDARADGYARGEGAGFVVLKRLSDAVRENDPILALVHSTGVNQDGRTNGITVPSGEAQEALMREVCAQAGIDPRKVAYVEAHGTGTALGDPTEAAAIGAVYGRERSEGAGPCIIGSVKSNIGHLEAASGIAGVIKSLLCLVHNRIPPLATLETPNPSIPFTSLGLRLADDLLPLADRNSPAFIGVNSFGYGGTNAHVLLGSAPDRSDEMTKVTTAKDGVSVISGTQILPLSAESEAGLRALASSYIAFLENTSDAALDDVVFSAAVRRSHLTRRLAVIGHDRRTIVERLKTFFEAGRGEGIHVGRAAFSGAERASFIFTGMGPQWWAMGQELFQSERVYRETAEEIDAEFYKVAGFSILSEMLQSEAASRLTETQYAQPANFLLQVGLAKVLESIGIRPGAIVGHSVGEVSAAYVAGVLNLKDAVSVSYHRSRLQKTAAGTGSMLAVGLSEIALQSLVEDRKDSISIAAINSPSNITLAGDTAVLAELADLLTADNIFNRPLQVEVPYHSPMMEELRDELLRCLVDLRPNEPRVPLYSSVTGERVEGISLDATYWFRNIRHPVLFAKAIRSLLNDGCRTFIEVGPHPVLSASLKECFAEANLEARSIETLRRNRSEIQNVSEAAAAVYAAGGQVDWRTRYSGRLVRLPNYPWQREKLWKEAEATRLDRLGDLAKTLLGCRLESFHPTWETELNEDYLPYLPEHKIQDLVMLPAAAYLEVLLQLHRETLGDDIATLRNVRFSQALILIESQKIFLTTTFNPKERTAVIATRRSRGPENWSTHAEATLYSHDGRRPRSQDIGSLRSQLKEPVDIQALYQTLRLRGLEYGPHFQTITSLYRGEGDVLAHIVLVPRPTKEFLEYRAHPSLLDGCFQALIAVFDDSINEAGFVPVALRELTLHRAFPERLWCHGRLTAVTVRTIECDFEVYTEDGAVVAEVRGLQCQALLGDARQSQEARLAKRTYQYHWSERNGGSRMLQRNGWLIISDAQGISDRLADEMRKLGVGDLIMAGPNSTFSEVDGRLTLIESLRETNPLARVPAAMDLLHRTVDPIAGIVLLNGLDAGPENDDPVGIAAGERVLAMLQSLSRIKIPQPRIYLVTRAGHRVVDTDASVNPAQGTLIGITRVAFNELQQMHCTSVDLSEATTDDELRMLAIELVSDFTEDEVALRPQGRFVSNLEPTEPPATTAVVQLDTSQETGFVLAEFAKRDGTPIFRETAWMSPETGEIVAWVHAASGSRGLLEAHVPETQSSARALMFISGVVSAVGEGVKDFAIGDRICGYVRARLANQAVLHVGSAVLVKSTPDIPAAVLTSSLAIQTRALYLVDQSEIGCKSTVLVYADVFGLALIQAAKAAGAVIIALGNPEFGADLSKRFGADYVVWNAAEMQEVVKDVTDGNGVNVLAAPVDAWMRTFDFSTLAENGCVVNTADGPIDVRIPLGEHVGSIINVTTNALAERHREILIGYLSSALDELASGSFRPLPQPTLLASDLLSPKLLDNGDKDFTVILSQPGARLPVQPLEPVPVHEAGTYVISGGFGGVGSEVARWLARNGARNLALLGRRGLADSHARAFVQELQELGVRTVAPACDIADPVSLGAAFDLITGTMPPVRGVIHSAAVLADAPLVDLTSHDFRRVMLPKALGAWHLHNATKNLSLEFFILFSSISALVGNSGQTNYVAANCYLDALAWHRRTAGLPATSINWGAISDVGIVTRSATLQKHLEYTGLIAVPVADALFAFGKILAKRPTQLCVAEANWQQWARYETRGGKSPRFAHLVGATDENEESLKLRLRDKLLSVEPQDRQDVLAYLLSEIFGPELRMTVEEIDIHRPFNRMGIDSLMGVELLLSIEMTLGIRFSAFELVGDGTIFDLASKCLAQLKVPIASVDMAA